ncbi:hypothetical protein M0804_014601 [Polistes exclamans]|nr:hypothetical protein M0804_014601 [Polistes exclamans]
MDMSHEVRRVLFTHFTRSRTLSLSSRIHSQVTRAAVSLSSSTALVSHLGKILSLERRLRKPVASSLYLNIIYKWSERDLASSTLQSDKRTLAAGDPHVRSTTHDPCGQTHVGLPVWLPRLRFNLLAHIQSNSPLGLLLPSGSHLGIRALKSPSTSAGRAGSKPESYSS